MSLHNVFSSFAPRAGLSFAASLALGAMLAALLVVAYAAGASPLASVRANIILQGAEMIVLTLSAGVIAGAVHWIGTLGEGAMETLPRARRAASA